MKHLHIFKADNNKPMHIDPYEFCLGEGCNFQMKDIRDACYDYNRKHKLYFNLDHSDTYTYE